MTLTEIREALGEPEYHGIINRSARQCGMQPLAERLGLQTARAGMAASNEILFALGVWLEKQDGMP